MIANQLNSYTLGLINLPEEILNVVCHSLTIPELNALQFVSKQFYEIANNPLLWIALAKKHKITLSESLSDSYEKISPKKELILSLRHRDTLEMPDRALHAHVIRIIGIEAFDNIPTFQIERPVHTGPIMKLVESLGRPIISLRYVNRSETRPLQQKIVCIFSAKHGPSKSPKDWMSMTRTHTEIFQPSILFDEKAVDRLNRLLKHEPCGGIKELDDPQAPRTLPSGESIFELV
jgi:F-box domain